MLYAAKVKGMNTIYASYNHDMTENFIKDCAFWAKHFNLAASQIEQVVLKDENKDILAYQIRFASGFTIKALSGKPNNIRGKQARVVIDEAAFCDDLGELIKAAIALLMWGGQISIISTHKGIDNEFNKLIEEIKAGDRNYSHHKITLDDALADGLYKRICLASGKKWTLEGELAWRSQLYSDYGIGASEELDCVPFSGKSGEIFNKDWFKIIEPCDVPEGGIEFRFYDRAATSREFAKKTSSYTAGVRGKCIRGSYYITHALAQQVGPAEGDDLIEKIAWQDGRNVNIRSELEGGSAGIRAESQMTLRLKDFNYQAVKPLGDKVARALPFASECKQGMVYLVRGDWNKMYIDALHRFDGTHIPLTNDLVDASSGLYSCIQNMGAIAHTPIKSARAASDLFAGY